MYKYIIWKFWTTLITLILVVILFYFLYVIVKGNPFAGNPQYSSDVAAYNALLAKYHINDPSYVRFFDYIAGIFTGDWGDVYVYKTIEPTIPKIFFKPLKHSMLVSIPAFFVGMVLGLFLGFWAGYKRGKLTDVIINGFITIFIAIPSFIFATFALVLAPILHLPTSYMSTEIVGNSQSDMIRSLILPIIVVGLLSLSGWAYILRNEVASILASEYIISARTKGLSSKVIFRRYVFRNSMYPYVGSLVTSFMVVFSSSMIVERFWNVPGTSKVLVEASQLGEINILMFNLIFFSSIGLFTQIFVDVAQFTINPIVRSNFSSQTSFITKIRARHSRNMERKEVLND